MAFRGEGKQFVYSSSPKGSEFRHVLNYQCNLGGIAVKFGCGFPGVRMCSMKTVDYYDNNAFSFYERTIDADLSESYQKFLKELSPQAHILDAGCGVGRDSKYFLSQGKAVTAFDASQEMVRYACQETGLNVTQMKFQDMDFRENFEAIWACASLLHVPYTETKAVYQKIYTALKPGGLFYASYKYGEGAMLTEERDFYNMTELTVLPYLSGLFEVIDIWKTADTRSQVSPSPDNAWLNLMVKRLALPGE